MRCLFTWVIMISLSVIIIPHVYGAELINKYNADCDTLEKVQTESDVPVLLVENDTLAIQTDTAKVKNIEPSVVWKRSLVIPGWGQATNRQYWKIPIIYGLLGGLAWNTYRLTLKYNDYKAAYYNLNNTDALFGPTPDYLINQTNGSFLQNERDNARQQRDQMVLGVILAYGLNVLDSFIYAHFKTFDVSDDLSFSSEHIPMFDGSTAFVMKLKVNF